jgi:hypothetical protein
MTTKECIKVAYLREQGYADVEEWIKGEGNQYVGRGLRVFIHTDGEKKVYYVKGTKWGNPYKMKKKNDETGLTLEECLVKYRQHIFDSGLINEIEELKGKRLGCWCVDKLKCHAAVLADLANSNLVGMH